MSLSHRKSDASPSLGGEDLAIAFQTAIVREFGISSCAKRLAR